MEKEINFATQNETTEIEGTGSAVRDEQGDLGRDADGEDVEIVKESAGESSGETTVESEEEFGEGVEEAADDIQDTDNFMKLYEESLKSIQEGEVVAGEIVQVDKEYVLVDIGYKSEGQIPIHEFVDDEGNLTAKVGDKIEVLLERREDEEGIIRLSK